ncbi:carbonic anhydrase 1-like isoform X2 [Panonychus citri]|uniref:carbonic anhydrase 1-like isoform X2 n=1 Tax=Panonychus citri TaxID=50023 RepID=UPI002307B85E|nr:carbonic anhydrase 1-like isoform X2 [Panonychus citri]
MSTSVCQQPAPSGPEVSPIKWAQTPSPTTLVPGKRQSPININRSVCLVGKSLISRPLRYEFPTVIENLEMVNSGHGWTVNIPPHIGDKTGLTDGPLLDKYNLVQFHAHWGCDSTSGSEHTIDGHSYASELHFVHYNSTLFSSFGEAVKKDRGLSVIAVFLEVGDKKNEQIEKIVKHLKDIKYKDEKTIISEGISYVGFFPEKKSYFTYEGSLTTSPYHESVSWIVFENPVTVTADQITAMRQLMCNTKETENKDSSGLSQNYRQPQPINGRDVIYVR